MNLSGDEWSAKEQKLLEKSFSHKIQPVSHPKNLESLGIEPEISPWEVVSNSYLKHQD